ncbi:MAG: hypothetical protein V4686_00145 [Patescibacteria group bacterium]
MKIIRNTKVKTITSLAFMLALVLTPALGFAKEHDKDKKENKKNNTCVHAFGQLIKNGWKENKGEISISANCKLPYGIFKKLNYIPHASSTVDTVAPVINSFNVNPQSVRADTNWTTNEKTRGVVFYGTTTPVLVKATTTSTGGMLNSVYSTNGSMSMVDEVGVRTNGSVVLRNLIPNTTYYVVLAVRDSSGNVTLSGVNSFTTSTSSDTTAPVISNIMTAITSNLLKISWKTNEPATSKLFYGTSSLNVNTSPNMSSSTLQTNHSFDLPLLASTTPRFLILQSTDVSGNVQTSAEYVIYSPF